MKQTLHVTDIDFTNLFVYEKALSILTPISSIGNLTASLIFNKETNEVSIYILDTTAFVKLSMKATAKTNDFEEKEFGILIDYKKFFYAINQYKDNNTALEFLFEKENLKLTFMIKNGTDKISLPIMELPTERITEFNDRFVKDDKEETYEFDSTNNKEFLINISQAFKGASSFIGRDEQKNNAGAIYLDKLIVNDRRHIYIQKFSSIDPTYTELNNSFISIHKKNMKIITETLNTEIPYTLSILRNYSKIYISTIGFMCILNNALANISPPTEEEMLERKPTTKIFETTIDELYKSCAFFNGFYSSANEIRPLSLKLNEKKELMLYLKDSGIGGFGEFSIEKILESKEDLVIENTNITSTIILDSIRDFVAKENEGNKVSIYMDDDDKPAVFVSSDNSEIYLAKLIG